MAAFARKHVWSVSERRLAVEDLGLCVTREGIWNLVKEDSHHFGIPCEGSAVKRSDVIANGVIDHVDVNTTKSEQFVHCAAILAFDCCMKSLGLSLHKTVPQFVSRLQETQLTRSIEKLVFENSIHT